MIGDHVNKSSPNYHIKRQCKGRGVMVWMLAMPNGHLSFKVILGNLNSDGYIKLLFESVVPTIKLKKIIKGVKNYDSQYMFNSAKQ